MIHFIQNKHSKSGEESSIWKQVEALLKKEGVPYRVWYTEYMGHATVLAKEISSLDEEEIKLVVVGGDGTINEVINGITDFDKVSLGVIPTGSGNDFARGMGLFGTPREQLLRILHSKGTKRIDVGSVSWQQEEEKERRLFLISSGVGMDAFVCKKVATSRLKKILNRLHIGKLIYLLTTIRVILIMITANAKVVFDDERKTIYKKQIFSAAMNFRAEGGGIPMAPAADAQDGLLSVCTIAGVPKLCAFFVLPFLAAGKHEIFRSVKIENCACCDFYMDRPVVLHTDGEYCADVTQVRYECLPAKLRMLV